MILVSTTHPNKEKLVPPPPDALFSTDDPSPLAVRDKVILALDRRCVQ